MTTTGKRAMKRRRVRETQLRLIRELRQAAARRGAWLTLGEIARLTDVGEASISAQLRHLRKESHGGHRVEKRVRQTRRTPGAQFFDETQVCAGEGKWEYRVVAKANNC